jgi:nucleotide-binding universal stress UspA family protein
MYNKVVVPLDGSKLAETALPHLEAIAKGCSIPEILLVSVTERIRGRIRQDQAFEEYSTKSSARPLPAMGTIQGGVVFSTYTPSQQQIPLSLGKMAKTAYDYLCKIAKQLEEKGFRNQVVVLAGKPAEEIVRFADDQGADLIIMGSQGKGGLNRWNISNIADKVIKTAKVPVLLVRPGAGFKETKPKRRGIAT